ncbi:hypothetical protein [Vibrio sp.]|uniref:hypothetical protein n=1 Tax=Vibrio sp. TaxID=678 RepID=UPI00311D99F4
MIKRCLASFCWIVLVALALPSQAMSYLAKSTDSPLSHDTSYDRTNTLSVTNRSIETEIPSTPISKTDVDTDALAIMQFVRLNSDTRDGHDTEEDLPYDGDNYSKPTKPFTTHDLYSEHLIGYWVGFNSQYRISGWKESNALYVALNGHFS